MPLAYPITLMERMVGPGAASGIVVPTLSAARTLGAVLRGSDPVAVLHLLDQIVHRIDIAADAVTIVLDCNQLAASLGIPVEAEDAIPLQVTTPVRLTRSGFAMRLVLPGGESASSHIDDKLINAIATGHRWWEQLLANPQLQVSDLARSLGVTESWVARRLWLAFLDPAIIEQVPAGKAPAEFSLAALREPSAIPTLWSAQRAHHHIRVAK